MTPPSGEGHDPKEPPGDPAGPKSRQKTGIKSPFQALPKPPGCLTSGKLQPADLSCKRSCSIRTRRRRQPGLRCRGSVARRHHTCASLHTRSLLAGRGQSSAGLCLVLSKRRWCLVAAADSAREGFVLLSPDAASLRRGGPSPAILLFTPWLEFFFSVLGCYL